MCTGPTDQDKKGDSNDELEDSNKVEKLRTAEDRHGGDGRAR